MRPAIVIRQQPEGVVASSNQRSSIPKTAVLACMDGGNRHHSNLCLEQKNEWNTAAGYAGHRLRSPTPQRGRRIRDIPILQPCAAVDLAPSSLTRTSAPAECSTRSFLKPCTGCNAIYHQGQSHQAAQWPSQSQACLQVASAYTHLQREEERLRTTEGLWTSLERNLACEDPGPGAAPGSGTRPRMLRFHRVLESQCGKSLFLQNRQYGSGRNHHSRLRPLAMAQTQSGQGRTYGTEFTHVSFGRYPHFSKILQSVTASLRDPTRLAFASHRCGGTELYPICCECAHAKFRKKAEHSG